MGPNLDSRFNFFILFLNLDPSPPLHPPPPTSRSGQTWISISLSSSHWLACTPLIEQWLNKQLCSIFVLDGQIEFTTNNTWLQLRCEIEANTAIYVTIIQMQSKSVLKGFLCNRLPPLQHSQPVLLKQFKLEIGEIEGIQFWGKLKLHSKQPPISATQLDNREYNENTNC